MSLMTISNENEEDQPNSNTSQCNDIPIAVKDESNPELEVFRQQWRQELKTTAVSDNRLPPSQQIENKSEEDKAKELFMRGVDFERSGKLYEAIQHYKKAMQILPDVETKLYESLRLRDDSEEEESEAEEYLEEDTHHNSDSEEDMVEGEDLVSRLNRITAKKRIWSEPEHPTKGCHISRLPPELLSKLARWVVGRELDVITLEQMSAVCRTWHLVARDQDLWASICVQTWGMDCGGPKSYGFNSWRQMYIEKPRLLYHGCYISRTTYLRHGENSFQDQSYKPWYIIEYYRYLRFFPGSRVLMWTTAEEPGVCVGQLGAQQPRPGLGIMAGHYRLLGDKVVIVMNKIDGEKKCSEPVNSRHRGRRKETDEQHDQIFHLELELHSVRSRRNGQLRWARHAVSARGAWAEFEVTPAKYPPLVFSRVRGYTARAHAPLPRRPPHCL